MIKVDFWKVLFSVFLPFAVSCGVVNEVAIERPTKSNFPLSKDCKSIKGLSLYGDAEQRYFCFSRDIVDGKKGEKKESAISRSLSGGHSVTSVGGFYVFRGNVDLNMRGFSVYSNRHLRGGVRIDAFGRGIADVSVYNGLINGMYDVFEVGDEFVDMQDESYFLRDEMYGCLNKSSNINFSNMAIIGKAGNVVANKSGITGSSLYMAKIYYSGVQNYFSGNKYVVTNDGKGYELGANDGDGLIYQSEKPILKRFVNGSIASYDHAAGLYLSCADNTVIDGNIFSSLKGRPDVPAIVLKRSRNVRITNNTFEGFAMPVLMDQYSSIIDASGNIIKPEITAENPASLLYKLKLEPRPAGTQAQANVQ